MTIKLSPSKLNLFIECPRCFYLAMKKGISRPGGAFPSLPSGMDLVLKKYYDNYRGDLPPELKEKVEGVLLPDEELIKKFRNWRTFKFEEEDALMYGAMDDCLKKDDFIIPLDFKTRGFDLKEDSTDYYQNQLDCYALMLEKNGYKQPGYAYLVYYIPIEVKEEGKVEFKIEIKKMEVDPSRAYKTYRDAVELLKKEEIPTSADGCGHCDYRG